MAERISSLSELIEAIEATKQNEKTVSLRDVLDTIGSRALAPLLLLAGLITLAPIIGDIPGVPTLVAFFVLLVAVQLVFSSGRPWLPKWLLKREVSQEKLSKATHWSKKPARWIDRVTHARLEIFVEDKARFVIAAVCIAIALTMPLMEFVPFSANGAGLALSAFGIALLSRDGALALVAFVVVAVLYGLLLFSLIA